MNAFLPKENPADARIETPADREDNLVLARMSSQLKLSWQLRLLSKQSRKSPPEKPECREVSAALISSCFSFLISQTLPFRIGGEQKMKRVQRRMGGVPTTKKKSTPPFFTDFLPAVRQPWGSTHSLNLCRFRTLPFPMGCRLPYAFHPGFQRWRLRMLCTEFAGFNFPAVLFPAASRVNRSVPLFFADPALSDPEPLFFGPVIVMIL